MFLNVKMCKKFIHDHNKQLSKEAIETLNFRVQAILLGAVNNARAFKRIGESDIQHTK
jgi:accessory colonization factor AcfC